MLIAHVTYNICEKYIFVNLSFFIYFRNYSLSAGSGLLQFITLNWSESRNIFLLVFLFFFFSFFLFFFFFFY